MKINEKRLPVLILAAAALLLLVLSFLSTGIGGDTDTIPHYWMARYAYQYPHLLLDTWGKPLFTLLSSPFAQLGYGGSKFFNILCGLAAAWLIYQVAKELGYKNSWLAIPFVIFSPIYMLNLFTSLTEILFSLVLVASIYSFLKKKYILSAIIISFIPFARNEGMMFLVIFLLAFLLVKEYKSIPFLFSGFALYSIIGYFHYNDFLWYFTMMPYNEAGSNTYGSGSFWFYFRGFPNIMGYPLILLALFGIYMLLKRLFTSRIVLSNQWVTEYLLVFGSFLAFILVHSFLWWKGMMAVFGSHRFMACILPLGSLMAVKGFGFFIDEIKMTAWLKKTIIILLSAGLLATPFILYNIPARPKGAYQAVQQASKWLKKSPYFHHQIFYFDPSVLFFLKGNPYENGRMHEDLSSVDNSFDKLPDSSVIIWESRFGGFENKLMIEQFLADPRFRLLNAFAPEKEIKVSGGMYYLVAIFQKAPPDTANNRFITLKYEGYEDREKIERKQYLADTLAWRGKTSYRIDPSWIYSPSLRVDMKELPGDKNVLINANSMIYSLSGSENGMINMVISVHYANGKICQYFSIHEPSEWQPLQWQKLGNMVVVDKTFPKEGYLNMYVWYQGKERIYTDDLRLEYLPFKR